MIENFKNSEFDDLFGVKSIKVPFAGERYKRINDNLATALDNNKNIRYIIRGLDADYFIFDKNELKHEQEFYPWYLYDDRIINDVSYWFNKEIMINALIPAVFNTIQGIPMTTFDEYDLICNLDNYKDIAHYSGEVNSKILEWMYNGEHELTKENNEDYWETVLEFYRDYPYNDMFIDDK